MLEKCKTLTSAKILSIHRSHVVGTAVEITQNLQQSSVGASMPN
jgi:hypothetical protein